MPTRDSTVNTVVLSSTPRRSPRFLRKDTPEHEPTTAALRKSARLSRQREIAQEHEDRKAPKFRRDQARSLDRTHNSAEEFGKKSRKFCSENVSEKSSKPSGGFKSRGNLSTGSKRFRVLDDRVEGFENPRRSSRISVCNGLRDQVSEKLGDFGDGSSNRAKLSSGLVKSIRTSNGVEGFQNPRRSPRLCYQRSEKAGGNESANEEEQLGVVRAENFMARKSRRETLRNVSVDSKAVVERAREPEAREELNREKSRVVEVFRKRKLDECEESNGTVQGWTKEQELALQRAYLVAKPTPHFWKKVSRLVPGKSAQDCFDKLNSDYATPPERQRVSRAKLRNTSPVPHFQLSASKVLKPNELKVQKPSGNKHKCRKTHKNVRQLLKEHYHQNQVHEVDFFSVLEPNLDLSTQPYQHSTTLSTPKNLNKKQGSLKKFNDRSFSDGKKPFSRFSVPLVKALASPPVLKQVKNWVLHEKYIDQLNGRDAKRKTASERYRKSSLRAGHGKENHIPKLDMVRAAKNALVSEARNAITMLQQMRTNATSNSSDFDDDVFTSDGDASDNEI